MQKVLLAPAERADVIVDFTGLDGKTVTLSNDAPSPYPGWTTLTMQHAPLSELMQLRVTLPLSAGGGHSACPCRFQWSATTRRMLL